MDRRRPRGPRQRSALTLAAALLLALSACTGGGTGGGPGGGRSGTGSGGEETVGTHSLGIPIVTGQWPFDYRERCGDGDRQDEDKGPACLISGEGTEVSLTSIAGLEARFVSDVDVTITYRGGFVTRDPSPDPANPERRFVAGFYDVTFPRSRPGEEELRMLEFGPDGADEIGYLLASMGSSPSSMSWPNGHRATTGLYQPAPGETLTFAVAGVAYGPTGLLGEHDPILTVDSDYTGTLPETDRERGEAHFALLDQDPDADVLTDARATIEKVAGALDGGATGGLEDFEATFAEWLDGAPMVSRDSLDAGAAPGEEQERAGGARDPSADGTAPADDQDGQDWANPPAPEDDDRGSDPADEPGDGQVDPWPGDDYPADGGGGPFDGEAGEGVSTAPSAPGDGGAATRGSTGSEAFAQPQRDTDPLFAAMAMADGLRTTSAPFYDCQMSSLEDPCATLIEHTGRDGEAQVAVVKLRLGPGSEEHYFDLALRIGTQDPLGAGWTVLDHWYYSSAEPPPDWAD